jgi:hypothetical protein
MNGASPGRRLSKRDAEMLLATYDSDPVAALESALRQLSGQPRAEFDDLVALLVEMGRVTAGRALALLDRDVAALDALAAELNETRSLPT